MCNRTYRFGKRHAIAALLAVAALSTFVVATAAPAAPTPIVGGSDYTSAVVVSLGVEYIATVSNTHSADYFYIDVTPGQIATVEFTSTTTWSGSAAFTLWDQAHVSQLRYKSVTGASQANEWVYLGNHTTPTRYYFKAANISGRNQYLFRITIADQTDGGQTGDAGDSLATATALTPTAGGITSYPNNRLGNKDTDDWFRITSASGQIISLTVTIPDWGGATALLLYLEDQSGTQLAYDSVNSPNQTSDVLSWVSNNTTPSAYLLRAYASNNSDKPLVYNFAVQLSQQSDGGLPGDAGDTFGSALVISLTSGTPALNASGNLLAASDKDDYFLIKLPPTDPFQQPVPYRFYLNVTRWPATNAFIRLYVYDAQQNPLANLGKMINAPSTTIFSEDITTCGSDGCYFRVQTGYAGNNPVTYTIRAAPTYFLYLPMLQR
jgi:hypothetical protein